MSEKILPKDTYTVRAGKIRAIDILMFCIAPFFIFNPEMALMDFIPDFIGYALLLIPLSRLRDVSERFDDVRRQINIALLVNLGKYLALFLAFGVIGQKEGGSASSIMMFSLIFAALDVLFVGAAFRTLFDAFGKAGEKCGALSVIGHKEKHRRGKTVTAKRNRTEAVSTATTVFITVRAVCFALPEFSTGSSHGFDDTVFNWAAFTALFRTVGAMVALVFGIIWLVRAVSYFAGLFRDKEFISQLDRMYRSTVENQKTRFILRDIKLYTVIASIALFLCCDVYMYEKEVNAIPDSLFNVMPDIVSAILLLSAFGSAYSLFKANKRIKLTLLVPASLWLVTSCVKELFRFLFFSKYTMYTYEKNPTAYSLYSVFEAVSVVDAVMCFAVMLSLCSFISYVNNGYAVSKLSRENESLLKMKDAEKREFARSYVIPLKIVAFVSAVVSGAYPFVLTATTIKIPDVTEKYKTAEYMIVNFAGAYWFIDLAVTLVLAFTVRRALCALCDRAENNLMLE